MHEDRKLKKCLVLQSFCPLFILVFIQHVGHFDLIIRFVSSIFLGDFNALGKAIRNPALGDVVISTVCIIWIIVTVVVAIGFNDLQTSNFDSHGEMIVLGSEKKDSGVTFLVTFVLPLLVNDVSTPQRFIFFVVLLTMVIFLFMRSDLFYQNPVLVALRYKVFEFRFISPYTDVEENKTYIGMTKGALPAAKDKIKRRYIADNVFLVYND